MSQVCQSEMSDINDDNTDSEDYTRNSLSSNSESDLKPDIGTDILNTYLFLLRVS